MKRSTVLVLCGGKSAERLVSLVSAQCVVANLDVKRFTIRLIHIGTDNGWREIRAERLLAETPETLHKGGASISRLRRGGRDVDPWKLLTKLGIHDCVFPVLHGPMGEDGTIQGLLELAGCAYVGCGVLGSAAGMDKEATKRVAQSAGLPQVPWAVARSAREAAAAARRLGFPVFIKPARMGSSVGVVKVKGPSGVAAAMREALRYDDKALVEKGIPVREIETAVLGDPWAPRGDRFELKASICAEIVPNAEFYDYKAKYLDPNGARFLVPAPISKKTADRVRAVALAAFRALDLYGLARADFFVHKKTGQVFFNEPNTLPGFTPASMYPRLWRESGLPTKKLVERLVALALRRAASRRRISVNH
jgi:D-alanine-D-alanine ligase